MKRKISAVITVAYKKSVKLLKRGEPNKKEIWRTQRPPMLFMSRESHMYFARSLVICQNLRLLDYSAIATTVLGWCT